MSKKVKFPYNYRSYALEDGYVTLTGEGEPSQEFLQAMNKLLKLAKERIKKPAGDTGNRLQAMYENLSSINTNVTEGRLLMAAMAMLTSESRTNQSPDECLKDVIKLADSMYADAVPAGGIVDKEELEKKLEGEKTFDRELTSLINRYNLEARFGNMPDFMVSSLVVQMLQTVGDHINKRDKWFSYDPWKYDPKSETIHTNPLEEAEAESPLADLNKSLEENKTQGRK